MKKKIVVLVALALVGSLVPLTADAQAAPAIQLLNPSAYNNAVEVSAKEQPYHFVAWVSSLPANAIVEFEIQTAARNSLRTINATQVGPDTFEGFDNLAGLADGTYNVVALLYSNGVQVDDGADSQVVTVRNSSLAQSETAEIVHPSNGGQLGFFTPPGLTPRAIVDVRTSAGARQVRVLITTSARGTEPTWQQCGAATQSGQAANVRCTLPEGVTPNQVTAVAAVANQAPTASTANAAADDSGDAHRVAIYTAAPSRVVIEPEAVQAKVGECTYLTARVLDQLGRPVSAANVDVHAFGPTDQLQFGSGGTATDFQPSDKGPHSTENARLCDDFASERRQGETNRIGQNDEKHIESRSTGVTNPGTNNQGSFTFALFSDTAGGTNAIAWADANDDDVQNPTEASGGARIGWGQDPPPPTRQIFLTPTNPSTSVGACQPLTVTVKEGGNALAGANVDIHLSGMESSPSFCTTSGGTIPRDPDSGEHIAGAHSDGTRHGESEASSNGQLTFGVSAASQGEVVVTVWLDEADDDVLTSSEPATGTRVSFGVSGDRSVSLQAAKRAVPKGRKVRLFGQISAATACAADQTVKLKARVPRGRFKTIKSGVTNASGEYGFRVRVRKTKDYRTVAPRDGVCENARSNTVRVRAKG